MTDDIGDFVQHFVRDPAGRFMMLLMQGRAGFSSPVLFTKYEQARSAELQLPRHRCRYFGSSADASALPDLHARVVSSYFQEVN